MHFATFFQIFPILGNRTTYRVSATSALSDGSQPPGPSFMVVDCDLELPPLTRGGHDVKNESPCKIMKTSILNLIFLINNKFIFTIFK
jgi:hypothetical protein